jgi:hypothetical protein
MRVETVKLLMIRLEPDLFSLLWWYCCVITVCFHADIEVCERRYAIFVPVQSPIPDQTFIAEIVAYHSVICQCRPSIGSQRNLPALQ